jgi:cell division protein FtsW (lipid II flippase)
MRDSRNRSWGITAIAGLLFLVAAYLAVVGLTMLLKPGVVSMAAGADLLGGLETAGPYMFLLMAAVATAIGLGLLRLQNWARRVAIVIAIIGIVLLVPSVSGAVINFRMGKLAWSGLGVIVRAAIVWYLYQEHVKQAFESK